MADLFIDVAPPLPQVQSKLGQSLPAGQVFVGNGSGIATPLPITGDVTIDSSGVTQVVSGANIVGTTGASNAGAGIVGQYASSALTGFAASSGGTTVWVDMVPLTLPAGDWDVCLNASVALNGATMTSCAIGISSTSGNSATGMVEGDNWMESAAVPVGAIHQSIDISGFRQNFTGTRTLYAKFKATLAAGNPSYICRMSARRMR